jgi:hypothetical protein
MSSEQERLLSDESDREATLIGFERMSDWIINGLQRVAVAWQKNALQG